MAPRTLHLICNAHIDPTWQWEWEEGAAETVSTFRTASELIDEFPEFVFCHNESVLYEWIAEYEPALFARIGEQVREGRWRVMGGWRLQPDCNMPSGEGFVRQCLHGRRWFGERFGVVPRTAINLDPFGHTRGLVQILAKAGYDSYLICRPGQSDCPTDGDRIRWVGYDGSEVLVARVPHGYNSPLGGARGKVEHLLAASEGDPCPLVLWGVGNHGGGPSRKDLADLRALIAERADVTIAHSWPEAFFADLREKHPELPTHEGDLNPWAVGCYTSQVRIKQRYRALESQLFQTEKMAAAAWSAGALAWPSEELDAALLDLLGAQFHDTLPGSSVQPVEEAGLRLLAHGEELVSRVRARAFFALAAGQPRAAEGEIPILVHNPHPWPVEADLECEFMLADQNWEPTFTRPTVWRDGVELPSQVEKELSNLPLDWRKRVVFHACLEPSAVSRFDCRLEVLPEKPAMPALTGEEWRFEGERVSATLDLRTGLLTSLVVDGAEHLAGGALESLVLRDNEDPWGMTVDRFREVEGSFALLSPEESARFSGVQAEALPPVRVIEDGPVRTVVEAVFGYGDSRICQRVKLPKLGAEVDVETRVHWNEKDRCLKLALPLRGERFRYLGQVAYGREELPTTGRECVAQQWVGVVADEERALTVIGDGGYGSDFEAGTGLRLTLLRSSVYTGHPIHDRPIVPQDRYTPRIDQGERLFHFRLAAGPTEERLAAVDREALALHERPMALSFSPSGAGVAPEPLAVLEGESVLLTAAKRAEIGEDLILRLFEPTGTARKVTLRLPSLGLEWRGSLGPFEIKTLRASRTEGTVTETDLVEGLGV